jgi:hypothetical protein
LTEASYFKLAYFVLIRFPPKRPLNETQTRRYVLFMSSSEDVMYRINSDIRNWNGVNADKIEEDMTKWGESHL